MIKRKLSIILVISLTVGCAAVDLSSPEKNYETQYTAIKMKNFKMFAQCFTETEHYNDKNLHILADKVFNDIDILSHRIIMKENTGDKEASILAEEISQRKGARTKTLFRINYRKVNGLWKIVSSETISFEKDTTNSQQ